MKKKFKTYLLITCIAFNLFDLTQKALGLSTGLAFALDEVQGILKNKFPIVEYKNEASFCGASNNPYYLNPVANEKFKVKLPIKLKEKFPHMSDEYETTLLELVSKAIKEVLPQYEKEQLKLSDLFKSTHYDNKAKKWEGTCDRLARLNNFPPLLEKINKSEGLVCGNVFLSPQDLKEIVAALFVSLDDIYLSDYDSKNIFWGERPSKKIGPYYKIYKNLSLQKNTPLLCDDLYTQYLGKKGTTVSTCLSNKGKDFYNLASYAFKRKTILNLNEIDQLNWPDLTLVHLQNLLLNKDFYEALNDKANYYLEKADKISQDLYKSINKHEDLEGVSSKILSKKKAFYKALTWGLKLKENIEVIKISSLLSSIKENDEFRSPNQNILELELNYWIIYDHRKKQILSKWDESIPNKKRPVLLLKEDRDMIEKKIEILKRIPPNTQFYERSLLEEDSLLFRNVLLLFDSCKYFSELIGS